MRLLSVDTSSSAGSVAILDEEKLLGAVLTDSTESHSVRLYPAVQFLLDQLRLELQQLDAYAVTTGPGSFAGLRIGVAAIKGFAELQGKPVVGVSTLEAIASLASPQPTETRLISLVDARRSELFTGVYAQAKFELTCLESDQLMNVREFFSSFPDGPYLFMGPDVEKFGEFITVKSKQGWRMEKTTPYLAPAAGKVALAKIRRNEVTSATALSIHYIRRSDAEIMFKGC